MTWKLLRPDLTLDVLGLIPDIITVRDPRSVAEQVADRYAHGGGWSPYGQDKWQMDEDGTLHYPGDPAFKPLAMTEVHGETVRFYDHAIVSVRHTDGSFSVVRMD